MSDKKSASSASMDEIVSLCKRRGFIYQGSDIYGGLAGTWDYGPLGVTLKRNIINLWWKMFVEDRDDMYGLDAAILMNQKVWQASGHVAGFSDPMVECMNCHARFREDYLKENKCPTCGKTRTFSQAEQFNMMFKTVAGPKYRSIDRDDSAGMTARVEWMDEHGKAEKKFDLEDEFKELGGFMFYDTQSISYLRPETAQGIFVNFKNVVDTFYPDLPFGIAQVGKAFRNEISPRDFTFRAREFEQMEIEYFVEESKWEAEFEKWVKLMHEWMDAIGIPKDKVHELEVPIADRAHYSKRTIDFEFDYPFGRKELYGLAYRSNYDLTQHQGKSGKNLEYTPKVPGAKPILPHVIEPSLGVDRTILAVLVSAYTEDEVGKEKRSYLKLPANLAPVKVAVSPLLKNKPELVKKAREVYDMLKKEFGAVMYDDNGNIGKRYRRQDEIGTPYCVTIDFDTLEDDTVTLRDRDTTKQERVKVGALLEKVRS